MPLKPIRNKDLASPFHSRAVFHMNPNYKYFKYYLTHIQIFLLNIRYIQLKYDLIFAF